MIALVPSELRFRQAFPELDLMGYVCSEKEEFMGARDKAVKKIHNRVKIYSLST